MLSVVRAAAGMLTLYGILYMVFMIGTTDIPVKAGMEGIMTELIRQGIITAAEGCVWAAACYIENCRKK